MKRPTMGIDLAKHVFEVSVKAESGAVIERKRLLCKKLLPWFANRPPALIGMKACGGAHYWSRVIDEARA